MNQESASGSAEPTGGAVVQAIRGYFREFAALRDCGREFWVVQLVNLLDGVAYFAMLTVSTLYLSETLGYSDIKAANLWGACMALYTATGLLAGFFADSLGIRRTLHFAVVILVASRLVIGFTEAEVLVIPALFVISVGSAIMTPVLISATKRYTTPKSQTAGFNMLYLLMNVGAFLGNVTIDPFRATEMGNRAIFMAGSAMSILCWAAILVFWRRPLAKVDTADWPQRIGEAEGAGSTEAAPADKSREKWESPWVVAISVVRESAFWRFMLFLVILVGVRLVFEHQYQVYPKYYIRTMSEFTFAAEAWAADGLDSMQVPEPLRAAFSDSRYALVGDAEVSVDEAGRQWTVKDDARTYAVLQTEEGIKVYLSNVPIGALNALNPLIICLGVIISTPIVARFKLFNVMFFGIVVSVLSMFILAVHPLWFCDRFGLTFVQGYRILVIAQIIVFSIGELIWYPRLYEYTAAIAPKGREASYMGLSYLPMVLARTGEGPLAGFLLTRYCPADITGRLATVPYDQGPQFMCLLLALIAMASPVLIVLFKSVIQRGSQLERDELLNTGCDE